MATEKKRDSSTETGNIERSTLRCERVLGFAANPVLPDLPRPLPLACIARADFPWTSFASAPIVKRIDELRQLPQVRRPGCAEVCELSARKPAREFQLAESCTRP
jgi:hypothetical protein